MSLSLLVPIRQRYSHLQIFLHWIKTEAKHFPGQLDVIFVEDDREPYLETEIKQSRYNYIFMENNGVFHKTKALNLALNISSSKFIVPFDIDLIPFKNALSKHYICATNCVNAIVGGYRLNVDQKLIDEKFKIDTSNMSLNAISSEDNPSALFKQLMHHERFCVLPFFERERLIEIGAWDEYFQGWGAEDSDVLERYLGSNYYMLRSPEFLYFHINHDHDQTFWKNTAIVEKNRNYYYSKRRQNDS